MSVMTDDRPEINIKPWDALQKELNSGNRRVKWMYRQPYAYWKGNPDVATIRQELVKCNVSSEHEWNARIYKQVLCFSLCCIQVHYTWSYCNAPFACSIPSHKMFKPSYLVDNHFSLKQFWQW
jgi:hypothetical protein